MRAQIYVNILVLIYPPGTKAMPGIMCLSLRRVPSKAYGMCTKAVRTTSIAGYKKFGEGVTVTSLFGFQSRGDFSTSQIDEKSDACEGTIEQYSCLPRVLRIYFLSFVHLKYKRYHPYLPRTKSMSIPNEKHERYSSKGPKEPSSERVQTKPRRRASRTCFIYSSNFLSSKFG
jgi:hypothetical protein